MSSKTDLLRRVNELQLEIQKSQLLLREARRRRERLAQPAGKSNDEKANDARSGESTKECDTKRAAQLFLSLVGGGAFRTISEVLRGKRAPRSSAKQSDSEPKEPGLSGGQSVLVLCKDSGDIRRAKAEWLEMVGSERFDKSTELAVTALKTGDHRGRIERADLVIFYRLNLAELWLAVKTAQDSLDATRIAAVVRSDLKMFLTEFQQRIKLKLV